MTQVTRTEDLPLDWNEWRTEWTDWLQRRQDAMHYVDRSPFKGKNMLADEILGVWRVNGRTVEISETVFMGVRRIGLTFTDGATDVVGSFAALEDALGL